MNNTTFEHTCDYRYSLNESNVANTSLYARFSYTETLLYFLPYTAYTCRFFMMLWLTTGIFSNVLSFFIWTSKHQLRKSSSSVYLAALAVTDLMLIFCLWDMYLSQYWDFIFIGSVPVLCVFKEALFIFTQYYSTALVFGFTLERYIAVCFPFQRHRLCSNRRALLAVFILFLILLIPMVFQATLWEHKDGKCSIIDVVSTKPYQTVMYMQEIIFAILVPLAALILNILVLWEIRRMLRSAVRISSLKNRSLRKIDKKSHQSHRSPTAVENGSLVNEDKPREPSSFVTTTFMLIILSFYLIICTVLPGALYLAQLLYPEPDMCLTNEAVLVDPLWIVHLGITRSKTIVDTVCASHYALNVLIYIITHKDFRKQAFCLITCQFKQFNRLTSGTNESELSFPKRTGPRIQNGQLVQKQSGHVHLSDKQDLLS